MSGEVDRADVSPAVVADVGRELGVVVRGSKKELAP
jgi:hypothetical protein